MQWDSYKTLGIVGLVVLAGQLSVFIRENWLNASWRRLMPPVALKQVFIEGVICMLILTVLFMVLRGVLRLACSFC
jgi:hypothetical protein